MKSPFIEFIDPPRMMKGKGAPRPTMFGVIGRTKDSPYMKSLGGIVRSTKRSAAIQPGTLKKEPTGIKTDRHILGSAPKTHIPGDHYAQVPYAGKFMSELGEEL